MFKRVCLFTLVSALVLSLMATLAMAGGRLDSVVPLGAGCVAGPTGNSNVESWDVQPGESYRLTFAGITNCANGGTDPTVSIMVKNSFLGNACYTATKVSTGVYELDYVVPAFTCQTSPLLYCVTDCKPNTGYVVGKQDGSGGAAHLRAATFGPACSAPHEIGCTTPVDPQTWGAIKAIYR